jgi:LysR family transcriptional regulator, low CO2-responsive transcriptional regulator
VTTNARLRALVELADTGSVRAAAQRLVVTESSVSAAVSALAADVGVPLVRRNGRGVLLTPAGERYAGYARRILGLHDEAMAAARGEADPERGLLRLAAVTTAGEHVLPAMLASFRGQHPRVTLRLEVAHRARVWPLLAHHDVDLVLAGRPPEELAAGIRAVSPNTLLAVGPPALATGFSPARTTWLMREAGSGTRETCEALLAAAGADPPRLVLGSPGAVIAAAEAGLGVTLASRQAVARQLEAGGLVELPMPGTPLNRPWHVVSHPHATAGTDLFVAHLLARPELGWSAPPPRR